MATIDELKTRIDGRIERLDYDYNRADLDGERYVIAIEQKVLRDVLEWIGEIEKQAQEAPAPVDHTDPRHYQSRGSVRLFKGPPPSPVPADVRAKLDATEQ